MRSLRIAKKIYLLFIVAIFLTWMLWAYTANAQTINELQQRISDRNTKIQELEKDIDAFQEELTEISGEKKTLQNAVKTLDVSRKKISTNIQVTENRIYSTGLEINDLKVAISEKESNINVNREVVAQAFRSINEKESESFIEVFLSNDSLATFWNEVEILERFQVVIRNEVKRLRNLKSDLELNKEQSLTKKTDLTNFKKELSVQKIILDNSRKDKNTLLKVTKNKESNYKTLLEEKITLREQFEKELFDLESQLKLAVDPNSIPKAQSGILAKPLDFFKITQYFGNTKFASQNPQVYNGGGHNGLDLRASIGTRVRAALGGVVTAWGNTDAVRGCLSYGKWILVKHNNGLSTLYAHLSYIAVKKGENVSTGDIIGYSGNSGYSTGPHLHFTVYATEGMRVVRLGDIKKITNCADASIPVADLKAYLNPLSYL